jgi:hypothetical protein
MDSGKFAMSSVMPYENYLKIMEKGSEDFLSQMGKEKDYVNNILEGFDKLFLENYDNKNSKMRGRGLNWTKSINDLLALSKSEDYSIYNKPFITEVQEDGNIFLAEDSYMNNGSLVTLPDSYFKKMIAANPEVTFIMSLKDLGIDFNITTPKDLESAKEKIQNAINDIKSDLSSDSNLVISSKIFDIAESTQSSTIVNPLVEAGIKSTDMYGNAAKDIQMASESTQFIGFGTIMKEGNVSSTDKYSKAWGNKANTGSYTANDTIMVSGSGNFGRGGVDKKVEAEAIKKTLSEKYKPLLDKAIAVGASFRIGNQYSKGNLSDELVGKYLKQKGYTEEKNYGYSRWTSPIKSNQPFTSSNEFKLADQLTPIQQNFGDGSKYELNGTWYSRTMKPEFKGKNSMDLIISGDRTRTTRAKTDVDRMVNEYGLSKLSELKGKIVRMTDKTGRQVYVKITNIAKFTQEYQDATWKKEGWTKDVTDRLVGKYPYAIEFEVVTPTTQPSTSVESKRTFKNEEYHQAYIKGGLAAVQEFIQKNKQKEMSAAKQLSKEVDMLTEFEDLNTKTNKTNSDNDRLIGLYVMLKNSKELDFKYSLNQLGLSTQPSTDIQGININTKSSDKLGRELTNPNWGAKNIMDIEAEYKANASKVKAPELTMDEALKYDMNLMYKLQMKKFKAHPELVQEITNRGGVKFLEASEHTVGVKGSRWEGKGNNSNFIKVLIKSYQNSLNSTQPSTGTQNSSLNQELSLYLQQEFSDAFGVTSPSLAGMPSIKDMIITEIQPSDTDITEEQNNCKPL